MDQFTTRTAAAAMLALAVAFPLRAQSSGAGSTRRPRGDTMVVRVIDAGSSARLDSIKVIMRALDDESPLSPQSMKLRAALETMVRALNEMQGVRIGLGSGAGFGGAVAGGGGGVGTTRIVLGGPEGFRAFDERRLKGWIGLNTASVPHSEEWNNEGYFIRFYQYPPIISVEPNSPAQRAGIVAGDVLVAYDGLDIVAHTLNVAPMFVPDRKLLVTVRRDGENKDYPVTVVPPPEQISYRRLPLGEFPLMPPDESWMSRAPKVNATISGITSFFVSRGSLGASLISISPGAAKAIGLEAGVLVNEVPERTPAFEAGLHAGDVIVSVSGQTVSSVGQVQKLIAMHGGDHAVDLQVIRDKKARKITVRW